MGQVEHLQVLVSIGAGFPTGLLEKVACAAGRDGIAVAEVLPSGGLVGRRFQVQAMHSHAQPGTRHSPQDGAIPVVVDPAHGADRIDGGRQEKDEAEEAEPEERGTAEGGAQGE